MTEINDDKEHIVEDKNDFLNNYLVDANLEIDGDLEDEDCFMDDQLKSASHQSTPQQS